MYKKIRHLLITFSGELKPSEIPAFRGALIQKVGLNHTIFHNHDNANNGYYYRYPFIQYKTIKRMPALVCLEKGVDEIHNFFEKPSWSLTIGDKILDMKVDTLNLNTYTLQVWKSEFSYTIVNWLPLNQDNWKLYSQLTTDTLRVAFLEKVLRGNILSFAKGMEWTVDKQIDVQIDQVRETHWVNFKNNKLLAHTVDFKSNVFLPPYIGLGKGVSHGFGMIRKRKSNIN